MFTDKMPNRIIALLASLLLITLFVSCKKEVNIYELNDVKIENQRGSKRAPKTSLELISIAYIDLFGKEAPRELLNGLMTVYSSFGDKNAIGERIVSAMLNSPDIIAPSKEEMRLNPEKFVQETYRRFYARTPDELEARYFVNIIQNDTSISPRIVYFAFMSSTEYKFY